MILGKIEFYSANTVDSWRKEGKNTWEIPVLWKNEEKLEWIGKEF